jgi:hypothetical protein
MFGVSPMKFDAYQLWGEPRVVALQNWYPDYWARVVAELPYDSHLLYHCLWHDCRDFFAGLDLDYLRRRRVTLHLMANTPEELAAYRARFDLPCGYGPVSMFVNERKFAILRGVEPRQDAIYVAQFAPGDRDHFKRHLLAKKIDSLRIVTYEPMNARRRRLRDLFYATFPELRHAEVNDYYMPSGSVVRCLNEARVQLALSRWEGCMLAFTEGLLCGTPAVSTRCKSGRTEFFHPHFVRIANDTEDSVLECVQQLVRAPPSRASVRSFALRRLTDMRERYSAYIGKLVHRDVAAVMAHVFEHADGAHRWRFKPSSPEVTRDSVSRSGPERPPRWRPRVVPRRHW